MDLKTDHMIISVNAENIFDKIQYAFMSKKKKKKKLGLEDVGLEGAFFNRKNLYIKIPQTI